MVSIILISVGVIYVMLTCSKEEVAKEVIKSKI